jgi:hypothetical protein
VAAACQATALEEMSAIAINAAGNTRFNRLLREKKSI